MSVLTQSLLMLGKKPLITMLEEIRIYIMDRFSHMTEENVKWKSNVCPAILRKMQLFRKNMRYASKKFNICCLFLLFLLTIPIYVGYGL